MITFETSMDKLNYLKGLIRLSKCNGEMTLEEQNYYAIAANNMGLSAEELQEINSLWTDNAPISISFTSKYHELFFIQEAIQICCIDGKYDEVEKNEIRLIAKEWGISQCDVDDIYSWVLEGIEWKQRGEELLKNIAERR